MTFIHDVKVRNLNRGQSKYYLKKMRRINGVRLASVCKEKDCVTGAVYLGVEKSHTNALMLNLVHLDLLDIHCWTSCITLLDKGAYNIHADDVMIH